VEQPDDANDMQDEISDERVANLKETLEVLRESSKRGFRDPPTEEEAREWLRSMAEELSQYSWFQPGTLFQEPIEYTLEGIDAANGFSAPKDTTS
jgi:hypothetical protein